MSDKPLNVLVVVGSLHNESVTRAILDHAAERLRADDCAVDVLDLLPHAASSARITTVFMRGCFARNGHRVKVRLARP